METETKKERFKRIAGARTVKILNMLKLLGNCANTGNYEYSEKDVRKIFSTLETDMNNVKTLFLKQSNDSSKFKL